MNRRASNQWNAVSNVIRNGPRMVFAPSDQAPAMVCQQLVFGTIIAVHRSCAWSDSSELVRHLDDCTELAPTGSSFGGAPLAHLNSAEKTLLSTRESQSLVR